MAYVSAPNYECVPLRSDEISICAMQSRLREEFGISAAVLYDRPAAFFA